MKTRLTRLVGYRGLTQMFLALVWVAVGFRIIEVPDADPGHKLPIEFLPVWLRVAIWWAAALAAVVTAVWPPPPGNKDRWGFSALVVPVAFRAISYTGAVIFGYGGAAIDAAIWIGVSGYVMVVADWPEPVPPARRRRK